MLGLHLEANAFAPVTVRDDFLAQCWEAGEAITAAARIVSRLPSEVPGFYARMDATGPWTPVPILMIAAPPGGPIVQDLFLEFLDRIRAGLAAALPLDGVYVASHGASSATGDEDSDGTLLAIVREIVGPAVPIVVTHDLHCNVSERLIAACDAFVAYRTNPHVDQRERAAEAADLLRTMLGGWRPAMAFMRLKITPPSIGLLTTEGPYGELITMAEAEMAAGRALNASVTGGFVFSDLPKCGMCVTVTAADATAAEAAARRLAAHAWAERARFVRRMLSIDEAVARAGASGRGETGSIILADVADNPGGGGRGNTTALLAALHAANAAGVVAGVFVAPGLAADAHAAGVGATIEAAFGSDFTATATVEQLSDGEGIGRRGAGANRRFSLGAAAALRLTASGMRIVVGSLRRQLSEPRMLEMHGIDIAAARTIVVKSRGHFRAGFDEFVPPERIHEVDAPGLTSPVLSRFAWRRLPRPIYPIDPEAAWAGEPFVRPGRAIG